MIMSAATVDGGTLYNPNLVVNPGETLASAIERHWRDHGVGGLFLVMDYNKMKRAPRRRDLKAAA